MNVTLNTNRTNTFNHNQNRNVNQAYNPNFTGGKFSVLLNNTEKKIGRALFEAEKNESTIVKPVVDDSKFFERINKYFKKKYNIFTDWIAEHFTKPVFDNKYVDKFADKVKGSNNLFKHFLAIGSLITSGMYMEKTLTNKDLDSDRKRTLAVNQGLTFLVSTAGAYYLDNKLNNWWDKVTVKYAGAKFNDENFAKTFINTNKENKKAGKALLKAKDYIADNLKKYLFKDDEIKKFNSQIEGMGVLKSMLVFALVYRYIVPVAVTPVANKIGDALISKKKAKEAAKTSK